MTEEQRTELLQSLDNIHALIHDLYPTLTADDSGKLTRHKLLVGDLAVHLVEELIRNEPHDESRVAERAANLLYAVRLVAPAYPLEQAAQLLLTEEHWADISQNICFPAD
jgi:hypothetical protein